MKILNRIVLILSLLWTPVLLSQTSGNEASQWYFGNLAAIDFMSSPPQPISGSAMNTFYSTASIADANGNLLFYTNGVNIWNASHTVIPNGSGLLSAMNTNQGVIILKQPGTSTIYYVFYVYPNNCSSCMGTTYYSIVDMSLAAGQGSVTTKNAVLYTGEVTGKLTATRHCNGVDTWLIQKESFWWNSSQTGTATPNFRANLLSSAGINTTAVLSPASTFTWNNWSSGTWDYWGSVKVSPNGKKIAVSNYNNWTSLSNQNLYSAFELYDFDNSTGVVTNSLSLPIQTISTNWAGGWSVEFSPDGTKLYGSRWTGVSNNHIYQWDLCAGSGTAIAASIYTLNTNTNNNNLASLQLAPNGKIYATNNTTAQTLDVINTPNMSGAACGYSIGAQSTAPGVSLNSLPNFMTSYLLQKPVTSPFTYTVNNSYGCQSALFMSPGIPGVTMSGCAVTGYSLTSLMWNFGDPASGGNNISFQTNPIHAFTSLGTYTVELVLYYSCGGGTDTLRQVVNINQPCITVNSTSITCANLGSATVQATGGIGPFSYTWMPTNQSGSVAIGLAPGSYTLTVFDFGNNFTYTAQTAFTSLIPLTGNVSTTWSVACNGAKTGTGSVTNLSGGSGNQTYLWTNGVDSYTTAFTNSLSAGIWSINVTDAVTGCQINQSFFINQPPPQSLLLSSSVQTACVGSNIVLTGTNSGGTPYTSGPAYTYSWTGGPAQDNFAVGVATGGTYVYTLTSRDSYSCPISQTIAVDFINNPVITVSSVSICPLQTGTLVASGATSYTWSNMVTGNTLADNPQGSQQYTVIGSAASCTSTAIGNIILKPVPSPFASSNSPRCNGQSLIVNGFGGISYLWSGPNGFSSNQQSPLISPVNLSHTGVYQVTVTAANNCTAMASNSVIVHPTPTLSAMGSTACSNGVMNLFANSTPGASYQWTGPSFASSSQNPSINNPTVNRSGNYYVLAKSAEGCTNSAVVHVTVTQLPQPAITSNGPKCEAENLLLFGSGGDAYQWQGPGGFSNFTSNPVLNSVSALADGIYTLTVTKGPCMVATTKSITVYPLPHPVAFNTGPVCHTKAFTLSVNVPNTTINTYHWSGPGGFSTTGSMVSFNSANLSQNGVYHVTVTDNHSCKASTSTTLEVRNNPVLNVTNATVCLNSPAIISASGAVNYHWLGPDFFESFHSEATIPVAGYTAPQTYTVWGTAANSCSSMATAKVNTRQLPKPKLSVSPSANLCIGSKVLFSGFGGEHYQWRGPNNLYYEGQKAEFVLDNIYQAGSYTLTAIDNMGCRASADTVVNLIPLPTGSLFGNKTGCVPYCTDLYFNPLSESIKTNWTYNKVTTTKNTLRICVNEPGEHAIKGSYYDTITGCAKEDVFYVTGYELPRADFTFSPEHPLENNEIVIFTNTSKGENITSHEWFFFNNDEPVRKTMHQSYFFDKAGTYPIALVTKNQWGCTDTVVKSITVAEDFQIYVPNAFTPDGDQLNDVFLPIAHGIKLYQLEIYNRWGERLFVTKDLQEGWDGYYKGELCKGDVYTWKISSSSWSGKQEQKTGTVVLIR